MIHLSSKHLQEIGNITNGEQKMGEVTSNPNVGNSFAAALASDCHSFFGEDRSSHICFGGVTSLSLLLPR